MPTRIPSARSPFVSRQTPGGVQWTPVPVTHWPTPIRPPQFSGLEVLCLAALFAGLVVFIALGLKKLCEKPPCMCTKAPGKCPACGKFLSN